MDNRSTKWPRENLGTALKHAETGTLIYGFASAMIEVIPASAKHGTVSRSTTPKDPRRYVSSLNIEN